MEQNLVNRVVHRAWEMVEELLYVHGCFMAFDLVLYVIYCVHKKVILDQDDLSIAAFEHQGDPVMHLFMMRIGNIHWDNITRNALLSFYDNLDSISTEAVEDSYLDIINAMLAYSYERQGRDISMYRQPKELTDIVSRILLSFNVKSVYNPFAGSADFCYNLPKEIAYHGEELNTSILLYARLRLDAAGRNCSCVKHLDSVNNWDPQNADAIVSNLPWGLRVSAPWGRTENCETFFMRQAANMASTSIGVYSMGMVYRSDTKDIRADLVHRDLVDTIINLPSHIFPSTNVLTCIIITNRNKRHKGKVKMIDASTFFIKQQSRRIVILDVEKVLSAYASAEDGDYVRYVDNETISRNGYRLDMGFYQSLDSQIKVPEGYRLLQLKDFCTIRHNIVREDGTGPIINTTMLSTPNADCVISADDCPLASYTSGFELLNSDALLVSKTKPLRPTYFVHEKVNAYCRGMFILDVDPKVATIRYVIGELNKQYVLQQYMFAGFLIPRVGRDDLLNIKILVPSLAQQEIILSENAKGIEAYMEEKTNEAVAKFQQEMRSRKHSLKQNSGAFSSNWRSLCRYIERNGGIINIEDSIGVINPIKVKTLIESMSANLSIISNKIEHLADPEIDYGNIVDIKPTDFVVEYISKHQSTKYRYINDCPQPGDELMGDDGRPQEDQDVQIPEEEDKIQQQTKIYVIPFPHRALVQIFDNVISNAMSYGFEDDKDNVIRISWDLEDDKINILIENNGCPLKEGVSEEDVFLPSYTTKMNIDGHMGEGATEVREIMRRFGGDATFISTPSDEFVSAYKLTFKNIKKSYE